MAFITLSDYDNEIDVTVFPNIFSKYFNSLSANKIIGVKGNYQIRDERPQIVANEIIVLEEQQDE
jgi:DNA polymerase III alpha subunit